MQPHTVFRSSVLATSSGRWFFVLAILVIGSMATDGGAQTYRQEPIDRTFENKRSTVKRFVKAPSGDPAARELYSNYFKRYFFPAMKQSAPEDLGKVGELRFSLFKDYLWQGDASIQKELTAMAYTHARGVVARHREYHPAVGYNAVLVLAGLDAQYGSDSRATNRPPTPLPAANRLLCGIARAAADQKAPLAFESGALVGLERHTRYIRALPQEARNDTFRTLLKVAGQSKFPAGTPDDVRGWIKRQACQAIANLGNPGPRGVFANTLLAVVADETLPLATRCEVAGMLGGIKLEGAPGVDFDKAYASLQSLAAAVGADAGEIAAEYKDLLIRGGRVGAMQHLLDPQRFYVNSESSTNNDELRLRRRPLIAKQKQLGSVMTAVEPLAGGKADEVKRYSAAIGAAYSVTSNTRADDLDIAEALGELAGSIEQLTPAGVVAGSGTKEGSATKEAIPAAEGSATREGSGAKEGPGAE